MTRSRSAVFAIALGLGMALAAARIVPGRTPPLYDGVPVSEPYVWLDPPPGHPGGPSSRTVTLPVSGGASPLVTVDTLEIDPQAEIFVPPGGLHLPAGTTSLTVSITAVEPKAQPTDGDIAGNVYSITIVNQAGAAVSADAEALANVIMRVPDPTATVATVELYANGAWAPLKTFENGPAHFSAVVTQLGDFAMVVPAGTASVGSLPPATSGAGSSPPAPTPAASGSGTGSPGSSVTLYAGIAIAAVLAGLLLTALLPGRGRRNRNRNRGWSDRPPRRTRR